MSTVALKVGELARRTGLTVRTLHFYEEIGLLKPGERTDGGHRLYGPAEVARLQRITSMRQLGFTLEEIGDLLDGREGRADVVIERHIALLRAEIAQAQGLIRRLTRLRSHLPTEPEVEDLLLAIEETVVHEPWFTAEQLAEIERHRREQGPESLQRAWQTWTEVAAEARVEQLRGTPPSDPRALDLARRWTSAIDRLMPPDAAIRAAGGQMFRDREDALEARLGISGAVRAWLHQALALAGRTGTLRVPGAALYHEVRGSGPLLVLLPGGDGDADALRPLADHLVDRFTVLTYDRRGQTRSPLDDPGAPVSIALHADDLHRLIAAWTTDPVLAFGGSLGALVGLALVERHPEQVRTLVAHEAPTPNLLPEEQRRVAEQAQGAFEVAYREQGVQAAIAGLVASVGGLGLDDREPGVELPGPSPRRAANLQALLTRDAPAAREHQPDLTALRSASSGIVTAAGTTNRAAWTHQAVQALAAALGTEVVTFPGGHNGYAMQPRAFAARLCEVLVDRPGPVR